MSARLEGIAAFGMAVGVAAMLQPWWTGGMRAGFFLAAACTIAQIVFSHARTRAP